MPVTLSYPGVYIEEVPSGVRTITGVATSTAFVGRALRGPVDNDAQYLSPVRINSFAEYQRSFGGLWDQSPMSFPVNHYFQNGGADAWIVSVVSDNVAGQLRKLGIRLATCWRLRLWWHERKQRSQ